MVGSRKTIVPLSSKWLDTRYKNLSAEDRTQLDALKKLFTQDNYGIPDASKIGKVKHRINITKLPNLNKSFAQRAFENSFGYAIKETLKDQIVVKSEDIELNPEGVAKESEDLNKLFQDVFTNPDNSKSNKIPVHFRALIEINSLLLEILN